MATPDACLGFLGKRVRATVEGVAGIEGPLEADIFAVDAVAGRVVFRRPHQHTYQKADYFFVPLAAVTDLTVRSRGVTGAGGVGRSPHACSASARFGLLADYPCLPLRHPHR